MALNTTGLGCMRSTPDLPQPARKMVMSSVAARIVRDGLFIAAVCTARTAERKPQAVGPATPYERPSSGGRRCAEHHAKPSSSGEGCLPILVSPMFQNPAPEADMRVGWRAPE